MFPIPPSLGSHQSPRKLSRRAFLGSLYGTRNKSSEKLFAAQGSPIPTRTWLLRQAKTSGDGTLRFCHFSSEPPGSEMTLNRNFLDQMKPSHSEDKTAYSQALRFPPQSPCITGSREDLTEDYAVDFFFFFTKIKQCMSFISLSPQSRGKKRDTICSPSGTST